MLARDYRFVVENQSGGSLSANDITLEVRRWKFDSAGALSYESSAVTLNNSGSIADAAYGVIGAAQDNSSNKYLGGHVEYQVDFTTPPAGGAVRLWLQRSTDGGTTFDDDGEGVLLGSFTISDGNPHRKVAEF